MQILFDHQVFARQAVGGVSRSFVELAKAINANGSDYAEIFAPLHWNKYLLEPENRALSFGAYITKGATRFWEIRWRLNQCATAARTKFRRPDIFHETWYHDKPPASPRGVHIVTTVHDLIYQIHPEWTRDSAERNLALAASIKRADLIICVSEHTRTDLLNWTRIDETKVRVAHLGSFPLPPPARLEWKEEPRVLYVGMRGQKHKNFSRFVEAIAIVREQLPVKICLFGGGRIEESDHRLLEAAGIPLGEVHQISGDDSVLHAAYQNSTCFVCPSLYEGFGLPILEAMQSGCPVACGNRTSLPEVAGGAAFLFDPTDTESMAQGIRRVLQDDVLQNYLREKGRIRAAELTWQRSAEAVISGYRSIL